MSKGGVLFMDIMLSERCSHFARLFLRVCIGILMLSHGIAKIENFNFLTHTFPDPLGWGPVVSLVLIILAEVGCSILLIVGLMTRLALLPLIFGMSVAAFFTAPVVTLSGIELPLLYLVVFLVILMLGPGNCSVDYVLKKAYERELPAASQPEPPVQPSAGMPAAPPAEEAPFDPFQTVDE